jgi:hypothetical protein
VPCHARVCTVPRSLLPLSLRAHRQRLSCRVSWSWHAPVGARYVIAGPTMVPPMGAAGLMPSVESISVNLFPLDAVRAANVFRNQRFPTKTPIKFRSVRVQRQVTTRTRGEWRVLVDTNFGNLDRPSGATVAEAGDRRREQSFGVTRHSATCFGVYIMQRSRLSIQINQEDPYPAWVC